MPRSTQSRSPRAAANKQVHHEVNVVLPPLGAQPPRVEKTSSFSTISGCGGGDEEEEEEDDEEEVLIAKPKGRRPKIGDYTGPTKLVLYRASSDFKAYLVAVDFFPANEAALIWALDSFNRALQWYRERYPTLEFPTIPYTLAFESIVSPLAVLRELS